MTLRLDWVVFDAHDPGRLARFWAELLERDSSDGIYGPQLPGAAGQLGLAFCARPEARSGPNRAHLHLTSTTHRDMDATVASALRLGASHLDVGQTPDEGHVVLADPEGNEFCVIPPGNAYLEGCGVLGELNGEGTRELGQFWSSALDWPLVWDRDGETAVQAPAGGTKISWSGPPVAPVTGRIRQHLALSTDDLDGDLARLLALGASRVARRGPDGTFRLADPDGQELWLRERPDAG
ncbi:VOC family protein [Cellulomonas sp. PhB143]|uniref:VOC family protein n=1 Tax=Cellulomonas sp. PhB143 TaxID=2485186 RepID=UPI000F47DD0E|nr:VOC family protein [Cellulomonas sp. PhB143]ROS74490.1 hypothetical protein EDF32_2237 [Cellulomonas sp. PhB143]